MREYSPNKRNATNPELEGKLAALSELDVPMNQTASINIRKINQDSRDAINSPGLFKKRADPDESEDMELNMAQKRQFTTSKQKSKLHYSNKNFHKLFEVLDDFRMIYRARQIVAAMDTL